MTGAEEKEYCGPKHIGGQKTAFFLEQEAQMLALGTHFGLGVDTFLVAYGTNATGKNVHTRPGGTGL